ncbi:hypothetical protein BGZ76_011860 [Entomortierella beljakovae]|nr:hypothetical protein BGZ76_011860 [Entomortierella beljakovae]
MAPKTPQGTPKIPKAPSAGSPTPLTGIPAPGSTLQRRSFMPAAPSPVGNKNFQNMTQEQQALLAEAISIHSPGLIDPNRRRADSVSSVGSVGSIGSDSTPRTQFHHSPLSPYSSGTANNSSSATNILASPLSNRSPQARRTSTSRPNASPEGSPFGQSSNMRAANAAYSSIPPLSTGTQQQSISSISSPTADSPSGLRPLRLSGAPNSNIALSGTSRLTKQPLSQRPPSAGSSVIPASKVPQQGNTNGSLSLAQNQSHSQNQFPASLEGIELGDRVVVESMGLSGYLRFVGTAEFKTGVWAGIELDTPTGKNDGSVNGASKYIGMTASQLKQRTTMPQPSNSRQQQSNEQPSTSINTARTTIPSVPVSSQTTSPTPSTPSTRPGLSTRLSQPGSKVSTLSQARAGVHNRTGSISSPTTATTTSRPRTSPTPGRLMTSPRRLSSRNSDHSDSGNSTVSPNLLDQAGLVQSSEHSQGGLPAKFQQLQLDYGVALAENNLLKTEMNQTKSQLEMTRLLEKRDLSYDERIFLSKSLGRGGIDERIGQELEELHTMKAEWEKEKAAKDQEIKGVTEKMTQAWLEAARSLKEKTALLREKEELQQKLIDLEINSGPDPVSEDQLALIDSLKKALQVADERILELESRIQYLGEKAVEDETKYNAMEERQTLLERERDDLQIRLDDLEDVLKVTTDALRSKLESANRDAANAEEQLHEVQARLEHESELRRSKEIEADGRIKSAEAELRESQTLLAKSEKLARTLEDKTKDYGSSIAKREKEISDLKLELQDLAGMVQSEEVDRMRRVWENEKKRLEDAVANDITVINGLRTEIQDLESSECDLQIKIEDLEATISELNESKSRLESEVSRLNDVSANTLEQFSNERSALQAKVDESTKAMESYESETKVKIQSLEAVALTVETWKEQCEAMQLEMIQKTAKAEDIGLELAETQTQRDSLLQEVNTVKMELNARNLVIVDLEKIKQNFNTTLNEKSQLIGKVSELEAALALSASTSTKSAAAVETGTAEPSKNVELEDEIAHLKQMVHDLTRENVAVGSENKKLMQEHDNLMEAHKHVETECLKLMDEVERLHSESLAAASLIEESEAIVQAKKSVAEALESKAVDAPTAQSQSVIRLEGLLKEKQALLDRLTQSHTSEIRELRQRYVEMDRSKAYEITQLNKELTDLESLIESKIFHEADLEEDVQRMQKQIDRLQHEISDLRSQLSRGGNSNGTASSASISRQTPQTTNGSLRGEYMTSAASPVTQRSYGSKNDDSQALFCEICEVEGHDIISCTAVFSPTHRSNAHNPTISVSSAPKYAPIEEDRPYCENCEEYGLHYTDECPNESMTY